MNLRLYNSLTKKVEPFVPIEPGKVKLYTCGPTVYDFAHIGNLRTYIMNDVLRRTLAYAGYNVHHVMNITDVGHLVDDADEGEDKMTKALRREGKPFTIEAMLELARGYMLAFVKDSAELNMLAPQELVRASDHIEEDIALVGELLAKGFAYHTRDSICFDTSKFPAYGKLGNIKLSGLEAGARVTVNPEKRNPIDFTLWKQNAELGWKSPWGKGFPGWHIECSTMAMKYLGSELDIHTGGIDLMPTHHNNEIAQSEAVSGKQFVRYWLHGEHLQVGGGRMGKSEGNAFTLRDIQARGFSPLDFRYLVLTTHYRQQQNFTWEALEGARVARLRLRELLSGESEGLPSPHATSLAEFTEALFDDLNVPRALAIIWELMRNSSVAADAKLATTKKAEGVLALGLFEPRAAIPDLVCNLMDRRREARQQKNWALSDELRQQIEAARFEVKDHGEESTARPL